MDLVRHPSWDDRFDPSYRVVDYDPAWPVLAQDELRRVAAALGPIAVRLEHVGSTAVPGIAAKPIVDLQLSVPAIGERDSYVSALEQLGYLFVAEPESPDYHLFARPPERPRAFHLHVCETGSLHEVRHVAVRDYLRAHPDEAAAYGAFKRELVARHPQDRLAYIAGKDDYVQALERRAVAYRHDVEKRGPAPLT